MTFNPFRSKVKIKIRILKQYPLKGYAQLQAGEVLELDESVAKKLIAAKVAIEEKNTLTSFSGYKNVPGTPVGPKADKQGQFGLDFKVPPSTAAIPAHKIDSDPFAGVEGQVVTKPKPVDLPKAKDPIAIALSKPPVPAQPLRSKNLNQGQPRRSK